MNIGDKIPEILGIDQDGREIKASDYRGRKIVLYSYPKANTSGCTAEDSNQQDQKEELAAAVRKGRSCGMEQEELLELFQMVLEEP